jgi:hypothetical protein
VRRVDSLASVAHIASSPQGLELDAPLESMPDEASLASLARAVLGDRIFPRLLVSEDGRVFALDVYLEREGVDRAALVASLRRSVEGMRAWVSGVPNFRVDANARVAAELRLLVPLTLAAMAAVLVASFRSARALVAPLVVACLGSWFTLAAMGAAGVPLSMTTLILPPIELAIGCAYVVHLLAASRDATGEALGEALAETSYPIALSGLTTAIGFATMSGVEIEAVRQVSVFGSAGVLLLLVAALTLAPVCIAQLPLTRRGSDSERAIRAFAVARRPRLAVGFWVACAFGAGLGLAALRVETDATRWFAPGSRVRDDYDAIRERLSGITPMNIEIDPAAGALASDPPMLAAIDAFAAALAQRPRVGKVLSIADPLRQIHGGMSDDPAQPLPRDAAAIEQYLLLLDGVPQLRDLLREDRGRANLALRVNDNSSRYLLDLGADAEGWWREHGPPGSRATVTGIMYQYALSTNAIAVGQIRGLLLGFGAIAGMMWLALRSLRLVLLAVVPNALPVVIALGAMGHLAIPLDAGTVFIANIAFGISVDDTLHLLTRYRESLAANGDPRSVLGRSIAGLARAVIPTTLAIALGFAGLGLSEFGLVRNLGWVTAASIAVCLAANFHLLPALLLGFDRSPAATRSRR